MSTKTPVTRTHSSSEPTGPAGWPISWYVHAAVGAGTVTAIGLWNLHDAPTGLSFTVVAVCAAIGLAVGAGMHAHRWLAPRVGRVTAVAALALLGAVISGGGAALAPTCPGARTDAGRCSAPELVQWTGTGLLLPVVMAAVIVLPYLAVGLARLTWKLVLLAWSKVTSETSPKTSPKVLGKVTGPARRRRVEDAGEPRT